jgi:hypothetical protein
MKHCFTLFSFLLLLLSTDLNSQLKDTSKVNIKINAELNGEHHVYSVYARVRMPAYIKRYRESTNTLPVRPDTITDAPFRHGAVYAALKTTTRIFNRIQLNADIYGEYRGYSYGTFSESNTVLYPVFNISFKDSFWIRNKPLVLYAETGQFLNEKMDVGLMIYNMDLQRTTVTLRYINSQLSGTDYTDLYNGINLNIDDLAHVSFTQFFNNDRTRAGVSWVVAPPNLFKNGYHTFISLFGHLTSHKGNSYYGQIGYNTSYNRLDYVYKGFNRQVAALAGMEHHFNSKRFSIDNKTEIRYYGHTYNSYHHDAILRYRKPAYNPEMMYDNTIGKYLYPIRKFNTPFSQWSVFTEYQDRNVFAASLTGNMSYRSSKKICFLLNYDINGIYARLDKIFASTIDDRSRFIYPFFKAAVRYYPIEEGYISFFVANKTMNLDIGYPTHYLMRRPFAGIEFHMEI